MIDFRYHLVSIISIFLALAAGIALGAGPLKGQLGDQLQQEITTLLADKAKLNEQLTAANAGAEQRDAFIASSAGQLTAGRLNGRIIDIVVLPGADSKIVDATTNTLTGASARIGSIVTVEESWFAADMASERTALGDRLVMDLGVTTGDSDIPSLDRALAYALQPASENANKAQTAVNAIADAKFISTERRTGGAATGVVVIGAPVKGANVEAATATALAYGKLSAAMDAAGRGSVLIANTGVVEPATGEVDPLDSVRADGTMSKVLSTVDDAALPMGQVSVVYALQEQAAGGFGHYGLSSDAGSAFPTSPTPTP